MKQFLKFGLVGTLGFLTDTLVLYFGVYFLALSIEVSRVFSFLIAVLVTWALNRKFTFNSNENFSKKKEYSYYLIIQTVGALINYAIFLILVYSFVLFEKYLILPLAIASIIVMFFNFFMNKKFVFGK